MRYRKIAFLAVWLATTLPTWPQNTPSLIPYQGKLAEQSGGPVDSSKPFTIVFRIYSTPVGGVPEWQEVHENVSAQDGYFSVLLGSVTAFPDLAMFRDVVYVGITIDDGDPQTADVELRPRQAITPVLAAVHARLSEDATRAGEAQHAERADLALRANVADRAAGEVPVGGIVPYYGDPAQLPSSWRLCDGTAITDADSPLNGQRSPDLRGMFVRGVDVQTALGAADGQDRTPDHSHSFYASGRVWIDTRSMNGWTGWKVPQAASAFRPNTYSLSVEDNVDQQQQETHGHTGEANVSGTTILGGGHDNRPRFTSLHYIIRIK
jgi:hypothetical protein